MGTCCFTGPLPKNLFGYEREPYVNLINTLKNQIFNLYTHGFDTFITGGAQGVDQLAFWAVNALKRDQHLPFSNVVYIPFKGQESRWSTEQDIRNRGGDPAQSLFYKEQYYLMLQYADRVFVVSDTVDQSHIGAAMHKRNHAMVDDSELCFGVYFTNTWRTDTNSVDPGTLKTMQYAAGKGKPVLCLNPNTLQLI